MIMTAGGIVIRISLKQVSVYSRSAQGVKVINAVSYTHLDVYKRQV